MMTRALSAVTEGRQAMTRTINLRMRIIASHMPPRAISKQTNKQVHEWYHVIELSIICILCFADHLMTNFCQRLYSNHALLDLLLSSSPPLPIITALVRAVSEGLAAADNLQLTGLAVTCPLGNRALNHLSETLIRTLTVEAMVSFLRSITQTSLKRVVCIDITEEDNTPPPDAYNTGAGTPQANSTGTASPQNADALLFPACGNRMAGTLLLLLEQEVLFVRKAEQQREIELQARHSDPFSMLSSRDSYSQPFEPTIQLIACNMPLPNSIPGHTIYPILKAKRNPFGFNGCGGYESPYHRSMNDTAHYSQSHQQQQQQQQLQQQQQHTQQGAEYRQNEQCVLMVRGLSVCILRAIKSIKAIVAVPLSPQLPDSIQRHVYY